MKSLCLLGLAFFAGCASVETKVEINAPARNVRAALFKFDDYPKWNPFIVKVDGVVAEGNEVNVTVKPVGKNEITGKTTVIELKENKLLWHGRVSIPGMFLGKHEFIVEELGPNRTMFYQNERMSGLVVLFLDRKPTEAGFVEMNQALKKKAEDAAK